MLSRQESPRPSSRTTGDADEAEAEGGSGHQKEEEWPATNSWPEQEWSTANG